jgi:hypothetical protein
MRVAMFDVTDDKSDKTALKWYLRKTFLTSLSWFLPPSCLERLKCILTQHPEIRANLEVTDEVLERAAGTDINNVWVSSSSVLVCSLINPLPPCRSLYHQSIHFLCFLWIPMLPALGDIIGIWMEWNESLNWLKWFKWEMFLLLSILTCPLW